MIVYRNPFSGTSGFMDQVDTSSVNFLNGSWTEDVDDALASKYIIESGTMRFSHLLNPTPTPSFIRANAGDANQLVEFKAVVGAGFDIRVNLGTSVFGAGSAVAQRDSITGAPTAPSTVGLNINSTEIEWVIADETDMVTAYEGLLAAINATDEPVTATYVDAGDHSAGVYVTADLAGTPFALSLEDETGTLDEATTVANVVGGETAGVVVSFTDAHVAILNSETGATIAAKDHDVDDSFTNRTVLISCFRCGNTVFASIEGEASADTRTALSFDRDLSSVTFSTYVGIADWGIDDVLFDDLLIETMSPRVSLPSSAMTLADLAAEVEDMVSDGAISLATVKSYVNRAYREIYLSEQWRERKQTSYLAMHEGVSQYQLPAVSSNIASLRTADRMLRSDGDGYLRMVYNGSAAGVGQTNVEFFGRTVKIFDVPGEDADGSILVCEFYADLTKVNSTGMVVAGGLTADTDVPNLHPDLHPLVARKAGLMLMKRLREGGTVPQQELAEYVNDYKKARSVALGENEFPGQVRVIRR